MHSRVLKSFNIHHGRKNMATPPLTNDLHDEGSPQTLGRLLPPGAHTPGSPQHSTAGVGCAPISDRRFAPISQAQRHGLTHLRAHYVRTVRNLAPDFSFPSQWLVFTHQERPQETAARRNYPRGYPQSFSIKSVINRGNQPNTSGVFFTRHPRSGIREQGYARIDELQP